MIEIFMNSYKDGHEVYLNDKERDELVEYIKVLEYNRDISHIKYNRPYGKRFLEDYKKEHNNSYPDSEEIYKRYYELQERIDRAIEIINKAIQPKSDYIDYDFGSELLRQELLDTLICGKNIN